MKRCYLILLLCLAALCRAATPTTLRVVDLRWITGQPELAVQLGSLQGAYNRQGGADAIFMVRNSTDAALAEAIVRMYGLQKEVVTPGALLKIVRPRLTGQVLYDPARPWTRDIALTAAAVTPGMVIATDTDLCLPTTLDTRTRWSGRREAYAWAIDHYRDQVSRDGYVLAPESGHYLADFIAARKLLAVDFTPTNSDDAAALRALDKQYPAGALVFGCPGQRGTDADSALWSLTGLLRAGGHALIPCCNAANLSCLARFPVTRPLLQRHDEAVPTTGADRLLVLVYDGGSAMMDGSQSLDYATGPLLTLLHDPAMANLPVGVEVPTALGDYAPAVYQTLLAHQRMIHAEMVAAPNGDGWALPDAANYLPHSAEQAQAMDLTTLGLFDMGDQPAYQHTLETLAKGGWHGALVRPISAQSLPDHQPRADLLQPGFTALVGSMRVRSVAELRAALGSSAPCQVLFLDPAGIPPAALRGLLPEINDSWLMVTPSQAFRMMEESVPLRAFLEAKQQAGIMKPMRGEPSLLVGAPTATLAAATADVAIPLTVHVQGQTPVLAARIIYQAPDGSVGAADLRDAGHGDWTATLPPTLVGGTLQARARFVEAGSLGETISDPLTLQIPIVDSDRDGLDDTLKSYLGCDPHNPYINGDGLPDFYNSDPTVPARTIATLFTPIMPPADHPFLTDAGSSTAGEHGRVIPAKTTISYQLPLKDLPAAPATLCLIATGAGTVTVGDAAPTPLTVPGTLTEIQLTAAQMGQSALRMTITAGEKPVTLTTLGLETNSDGPYTLPVSLSPAFPPAGVPITVRVIAYCPHGVKSARVHYGTTLSLLQTVELAAGSGRDRVVFSGTIPAQANGAMLIYNVEAEDNDGRIAAYPYQVAPIGKPHEHSLAFSAIRDMRGDWETGTPGNDAVRASAHGMTTDTFLVQLRPGVYSVWMQAEARERAIRLSLQYRDPLSGQVENYLTGTVPAGTADGWTKVGEVKAASVTKLSGRIAPVGEKGYCAYRTVVFTRDAQFTPPPAHASIDWHNRLTVTGVKDGDTVGDKIALTVRTAGNIDALMVAAHPIHGNTVSDEAISFTQQRDGTFTADTRNWRPGDYQIEVSGLRVYVDTGRMQHAEPIITFTLRVKTATAP